MAEQEFSTRYHGYNVLDKWSSPDWDDQTRRVVRERLEEVPLARFFKSVLSITIVKTCYSHPRVERNRLQQPVLAARPRPQVGRAALIRGGAKENP